MKILVLARARMAFTQNPIMTVEVEGVPGRLLIMRQGHIGIWAFGDRPELEKKKGAEWMADFDRAMDHAWLEAA